MAKHRKRGDGSIHLRKDGRWEGRYVISRDEKGFPVTRNVLAKTRAECAAKLEQLRESLQEPVNNQPKPGVLLRDWLNLWYQGYKKANLRPNTQMSYERRIYQHIIPEPGKIPLNQLAQKDLQQFYARMKTAGRLIRTEQFGKGLSDSMVRGLHAACRSALEKAVQEGLIRMNPAVGCKLPPKKAREMQVLTREEIQRFLIQAKAEGYFELFLLELTTGLRRGELLGLKWSDIDLEKGDLRVQRQIGRIDGKIIEMPLKTKNAYRTLPLSADAISVLKMQKCKVGNSEWVFPSPTGGPMSPDSVLHMLHRVLKRAGLPKVRFHDLRHTFATLALQNGVDIKTVSGMLGHFSAGFTLDTYAHVTTSAKREAAKTMGNLLSGAV